MINAMNRILLLLALVFSFAMPAMACTIGEDTTRAQIATYVADGRVCLESPPDGFRFDTVVERAFVDKVNAERRKRGLHILAIRRDLLAPARYQSLDMGVNGFFDHQSPDGRRAAERIAAFDRTLLAQSTGENIAVFGPAICYDQDDNVVSCFNLPGFKLPTPAFVAEDLHQKLMDSEGHRANILSEDFTHIAVGVARTDSGFYITQLFANPVGELASPMPTQYRSGATLDLAPEITGWGLGGYALIDTDGEQTELTGDQLSRIEPGEKSLVVVGENKSEQKQGSKTYLVTEWLNLSGPSFTLIAATGS